MGSTRRSSGRHRAFASILASVLVVLAGACSRGGEPQAGPTSASPSPTATRAPAEPVAGQVEAETVSVHTGEPVFNPGAPQAAEPEVDQGAVDAFRSEVVSWLDSHLDQLQRGGGGTLDEVAAPGLLESGSPDSLIAITTALASPDRLVDEATYELTIAVDGDPRWAVAHVVVVPREGEASAAEFTFTPGQEGPILEAAGMAEIVEDDGS